MFSKLLKWDMKTHINILIVDAFALFLTLLTYILKDFGPPIIMVIIFFVASITTMGAMFYSVIKIAYQLNKDIYGQRASSYNMIGVKTSTLWHSKIITGFLYSLITNLVCIFNYFLLAKISSTYEMTVWEIIQGMIDKVSQDLSLAFGWSQTLSLTLFIAFFVLSVLAFQFSIGYYISLANSGVFGSRGGGTRFLLAYLAYYFGVQVLFLIGLFFLPINLTMTKNGVELIFQPFIVALDDYQEALIPLSLFITAFFILFGQYFLVRKKNESQLKYCLRTSRKECRFACIFFLPRSCYNILRR